MTPERPVQRIEGAEQEFYGTCGPASLVIAYNSLGHNYTEQRIIVETGGKIGGWDWAEMLHHVMDVAGYGVSLRVRASWKELMAEHRKYGYPIIVAWKTDRRESEPTGVCKAEPIGHFSVVKAITETDITIADPGFGDIVPVPRRYFEERWYEDNTEKVYLALRPR